MNIPVCSANSEVGRIDSVKLWNVCSEIQYAELFIPFNGIAVSSRCMPAPGRIAGLRSSQVPPDTDQWRRTTMKKFLMGTAIAMLMSGSAYAGDIGVSMANSDTFLTVLRKGIEKAAADAKQPV